MKVFSQKGFTIIELVVSIAIFAMMTALVISRYGSFNQTTLVTNVAYDMAITIRTAQTYGVSVKSDSSNTFNSAYGIDFPVANTNGIRNTFIFFNDTTNSGVYNSNEAITTYTLASGAKITSICLGSDPTTACTSGLIGSNQVLDITFRRPNPDAIFCTSGTNPCTPNTQPVAFITITSSDGTNNQIVYVRKNGQISVGN